MTSFDAPAVGLDSVTKVYGSGARAAAALDMWTIASGRGQLGGRR